MEHTPVEQKRHEKHKKDPWRLFTNYSLKVETIMPMLSLLLSWEVTQTIQLFWSSVE